MVTTLEQLYIDLNYIDKKEFIKFSGIDIKSFDGISQRFKYALKEINPEAMFCLQDEPLILFFNLENKDDKDAEIKKIFKQTWNFDKAPIIVISTDSDIVFYDAFDFDTKTSKLKKITEAENDFQKFAYENLYTGRIFESYEKNFDNKSRVQDLLFKQIVDYRKELINQGLSDSFTNILLSRIIFIKYLKDRKIIIDNNNDNRIIESFESIESLYNLFKYLKQKFNGDLFDIEENEETNISSAHMSLIKGFFEDNDINGQGRLFIPFDFSIIPVELVSNIYEQFLNKQQYENKAYYTPSFLVDYITNRTIKPFLNKPDKLDSDCKVLDPACGSGIFLIETLRKIIYKEEQLTGSQKISSKRLQQLVESNIFGIDKDEDAINIAIFSLYITLLDYQDPKCILSFTFPHLKGQNFFVGNFFDTNNLFNQKLNNFDFILSNPPYGEIKDEYHTDWFKNNKIPVNDNQIAQSFLVRAKDFCNSETIISMIVLSKMLYNVKAEKFRKFFLKNFCLKEVLELSSVRKQIFQNAITPVAILTYSYNPNIEDNMKSKFHHFSVKPNLYFKYFKIIIIEKYDRKTILQKLVYNYDWLWKTLLFGNILDFYFIKRIVSNFKSIESYDCNLIKGKGIQFGGGDKQHTEHLKGLPFLNTQNKELQQFKVSIDVNNVFTENFVHRNRYSIKDIFKAPTLLIKKGCNSNFECVSSILNQDAVFTDSVGSLKFKDNDLNKLYSLCGILNSNFFTYFILNYISAVTIERNQMHFRECLKTPYGYSENLSKTVEDLHTLLKKEPEIFSQENYEFSNKKNILLKNLNEQVAILFNLSDTEKDLIDYTLNISIPIWKYGDNTSKTKEPMAFKNVQENQLKEYCNIFIETFAEQYKYFNIDVYILKYCTLVNFKAREKKLNQPQINIHRNSDLKLENIIADISDCSISEITDDMYIKKDAKGFSENSFFVLKTNEYKNWHKAIARLDVNEFSNAIWEAELELS
jgi:hypothetical protein